MWNKTNQLKILLSTLSTSFPKQKLKTKYVEDDRVGKHQKLCSFHLNVKRPNKKIIYNLIEGVPRGDCDLPRSPWSHADRSIFAKERKSKYRSALNIYLATNWKFFSCRRDSERVGDRKTALSRFKVKGQETEKSDSKFQFLSPDHEIRLSQSFCFFSIVAVELSFFVVFAFARDDERKNSGHYSFGQHQTPSTRDHHLQVRTNAHLNNILIRLCAALGCGGEGLLHDWLSHGALL